MTTMPELLEWTNRLGLPAAILLTSATALWRAGTWLGQEVIKPIAQRHIEFLNALDKRDERQTKLLETIEIEIKLIRQTTTNTILETISREHSRNQ